MLTVENLRKTYQSDQGPVEAVRGISFTIDEGRFYTLLGPSGCGKSTTLRCVAGLERPDSGGIVIGEDTAFNSDARIDVPGNKRDIAMVFQSYAIWPHMTVFDNVAFPLAHGRNKVNRDEIRRRVTEALEMVQLERMATRPAPYLSGGQQQRVAVARALVSRPRLLLLDEPLSNLDARLREDMRRELRSLTMRLNLTTLYVTHDQVEALSMSDRIAVMRQGLIVQEGSPVEIYARPAEPFIAQFVGKVNLLKGRVLNSGNGTELGLVDVGTGGLKCLLPEGVGANSPVLLSIRPEHVVVFAGERPGATNVLSGQLQSAFYVGDSWECVIQVGDMALQARLDESTAFAIGDEVRLELAPDHCVAFRSEE